jgi:hypothetical protein
MAQRIRIFRADDPLGISSARDEVKAIDAFKISMFFSPVQKADE